MSALLSTTNFKALLDNLGYQWKKILADADSSANVAAPTAGTLQKQALNYRDATVALGVYEQELDLIADANTMLGKANAQSIAAYLSPVITSLNTHMTARGSVVNSTIVDIPTFLAWYNGGDGGAKFRTLVTPEFAALYYAAQRTNLAAVGVMAPGVHPTLTSGVSANGMGLRAVGGAFTAGDAINSSLYSEAALLAEVTVDFAAGGSLPALSVAGTDDTGATSTTWTVTLDVNNPTSALATTITPAVTAMSRQTVALASVAGIVVGSVMVVNSGLVDQEVIVVEALPGGSTITATFQNAHSGGAAIIGKRSYLLTPSVGSRQCRSVSNITITIGTHNAGTVRIIGIQPRLGM